MNPKKLLLITSLLSLLALPALADEDQPWDPASEVIPQGDTTSLDDANLPPPASEQAPEAAHVITPDLSAGDDGIVRIERDGDSYANITRANKLVERVALVTGDDGCRTGVGHVGTVAFCDSGTKLNLMGRPPFECPLHSGSLYGPCKAVPTEE